MPIKFCLALNPIADLNNVGLSINSITISGTDRNLLVWENVQNLNSTVFLRASISNSITLREYHMITYWVRQIHNQMWLCIVFSLMNIPTLLSFDNLIQPQAERILTLNHYLIHLPNKYLCPSNDPEHALTHNGS